MNRDFLLLDASLSRTEAAGRLARGGAAAAVLMDGDRCVGLLTPQDLLRRRHGGPRRGAKAAPSASPGAFEAAPDRIVVVDDSPVIRAMLRDALHDAGYDVVCRCSGEEALASIQQDAPELLLLDYLMPGIDGMEVLRRLKQDAGTRAIPVIIITSHKGRSQVSDALDAGAVDYIHKPFSDVEVLARVSAAIRTARLQQELLIAREKAEAADQAKSEFLANMSHEIRTPMTAILGYADVLAESITSPQQCESIETIRRNGEHLLGLINDILDLSKVAAGRIQVERIACSPRVLVQDVVELLRVRAIEKGLSLSVDFEEPIPDAIQTDPLRLRQILTNLVGNAIKFTDEGGVKLLVRHIADDRAAPKFQCRVVDSGIGMTRLEQTRLFHPFQQSNTSISRQFGGSGLGLTISEHLAQVLGGAITMTSSPGQGSVFTVTVDGEVARRTPHDERRPNKETVSPLPESENMLRGLRVLLAEDGPDNQRLISHLLRKSGAEVVVAENGAIAVEAALRAAAQRPAFDVILMDMRMPVLDGLGATRQLRETGYQGPIVALTANAMDSDRINCLAAGCDDFASKPIKRLDLLRLVARYANLVGSPS
ncbi:MAG: response regulator [Pirellulaceae bacterium]